jgi:hypothetical protein
VVELETGWDLAHHQLVGQSVTEVLVAGDGDVPIAGR